ncbi:threonine/homoserine/homoserine lactone efflux protein [Tamaricihabitans halophyticus]|uniref:Threonine/homoserine/homoserine lactone efflux protein n=1 Tax=Tamaricihabitans halophyticus TaxID=1262583 RepID=A0A4R2R4A3_9PSEU|nr:LysE family translocator [Tamaricihabitans halophyticus]TCP56579.1 threonine/homoserine/homoserine lactone efflux protein [Tamaricihabitans halophyticus]
MAELLAFLVLAILLSITPGPDSVLVVRSTARGGRAAGVATACGAVCGGLFWGIAAVLGIATVLAQSAVLFQAIKYAGAAYLVLLGARTLIAQIRGKAAAAVPESADGQGDRLSRRQAFLIGFTCDVLNPQVGLFYLAVLPQFVPADQPFVPFALLLCLIENLVAIAWLLLIALISHAVTGFLRKPVVRRWLDRVLGGTLIGLGISVAVTP